MAVLPHCTSFCYQCLFSFQVMHGRFWWITVVTGYIMDWIRTKTLTRHCWWCRRCSSETQWPSITQVTWPPCHLLWPTWRSTWLLPDNHVVHYPLHKDQPDYFRNAHSIWKTKDFFYLCFYLWKLQANHIKQKLLFTVDLRSSVRTDRKTSSSCVTHTFTSTLTNQSKRFTMADIHIKKTTGWIHPVNIS